MMVVSFTRLCFIPLLFMYHWGNFGASTSLLDQRTLFWKSNNAGLFSHFFQAKHMNRLAAQFNRTLVLLPFADSSHTTGQLELVDMCNVFEMGNTIICLRNPNYVSNSDCFRDHDGFERYNDRKHICFRGLVFGAGVDKNEKGNQNDEHQTTLGSRSSKSASKNKGKGSVVSLRDKELVLAMAPAAVFRKRYVLLFEKALLALRQQHHRRMTTDYREERGTLEISDESTGTRCSPPPPPPPPPYDYLVVHWRRGDQLRTRCRPQWQGLRDVSINCRSVDELSANINSILQGVVRDQINKRSNRGRSDWIRTGLDIGDSSNSSSSTTATSTSDANNNSIIVAIATNEGNITVLAELRNLGYILVHDVIAGMTDLNISSTNNKSSCLNFSSLSNRITLHPVEQFAIEAQFMIEATYFISYGVSTVNDVVESERRRRNHSWCLFVDESPQDNWCQVATNSSRRDDNPMTGDAPGKHAFRSGRGNTHQ